MWLQCWALRSDRSLGTEKVLTQQTVFMRPCVLPTPKVVIQWWLLIAVVHQMEQCVRATRVLWTTVVLRMTVQVTIVLWMMTVLVSVIQMLMEGCLQQFQPIKESSCCHHFSWVWSSRGVTSRRGSGDPASPKRGSELGPLILFK